MVPVVADEEAGRDAANMKVPDKEQYAALHAGDIAFVKAATGPNDAHLQLGTSGHRQGRGVDRMQKLCSFECAPRALEPARRPAVRPRLAVSTGTCSSGRRSRQRSRLQLRVRRWWRSDSSRTPMTTR